MKHHTIMRLLYLSLAIYTKSYFAFTSWSNEFRSHYAAFKQKHLLKPLQMSEQNMDNNDNTNEDEGSMRVDCI